MKCVLFRVSHISAVAVYEIYYFFVVDLTGHSRYFALLNSTMQSVGHVGNVGRRMKYATLY